MNIHRFLYLLSIADFLPPRRYTFCASSKKRRHSAKVTESAICHSEVNGGGVDSGRGSPGRRYVHLRAKKEREAAEKSMPACSPRFISPPPPPQGLSPKIYLAKKLSSGTKKI